MEFLRKMRKKSLKVILVDHPTLDEEGSDVDDELKRFREGVKEEKRERKREEKITHLTPDISEGEVGVDREFKDIDVIMIKQMVVDSLGMNHFTILLILEAMIVRRSYILTVWREWT